MVTHVIFDFDGTLVNTIDVAIELVKDWIEREGSQMTFKVKDYIPNLETFEALAELINQECGLSLDVAKFKMNLLNLMIENKHKFAILPGTDKLLKHLKAHNIPMAIATGNQKNFNDFLCSNFPGYFDELVEFTLCGMDDPSIKNKKPHPDIYLAAARHFKNPPAKMENVLIFEDSITGIKGALASQAQTVLVTQLDFQIKEEHADLLKQLVLRIHTFEEFRPEQFGLPAYGDE